MLRCVS